MKIIVFSTKEVFWEVFLLIGKKIKMINIVNYAWLAIKTLLYQNYMLSKQKKEKFYLKERIHLFQKN